MSKTTAGGARGLPCQKQRIHLSSVTSSQIKALQARNKKKNVSTVTASPLISNK